MLVLKISLICVSVVILKAHGLHNGWDGSSSSHGWDGSSSSSDHHDHQHDHHDGQKCSGLACNLEILKLLADLQQDRNCFRYAAFYVRVSTKDSGSFTIAEGARVPYDIFIISNNMYSVTNDEFVAPFKGLYQFTVHACVDNGKVGVIYIMKDSTPIGVLRVGDSTWKDCNSVTAMFHLDAGNKVWVQRATGADINEETGEFGTLYWNTFQGVLIKPDCNDNIQPQTV